VGIKDSDPENPILAMLSARVEELGRKTHQYEEVRSSEAYQDQPRRLEALVRGYHAALALGRLAATRDAQLHENSFFLSSLDDFGESAMAAVLAIREGGLNSARRELRFTLELATQASFVDQRMQDASFDKRVAFFDRGVKHNSVDHIHDLNLEMLGPNREEFVSETVKAWVDATHYAHPTHRRLEEKLALRAAGITVGFETAEQLRSAVDNLFRAFTIVVVLAFHVLGAALTGDILVDGLDRDDEWPFHASKFVAAVDAAFDYKAERQVSLVAIRERRARRIRA
jgi:hypothetical protein